MPQNGFVPRALSDRHIDGQRAICSSLSDLQASICTQYTFPQKMEGAAKKNEAQEQGNCLQLHVVNKTNLTVSLIVCLQKHLQGIKRLKLY